MLSLSNPFWGHAERKLYMAYRGGVPVARVAAIINETHHSYHNEKTGFFGFFETTRDIGASKAVLSAAEEWLKSRGMDRVRGPMNPSTNDTCGLLISGFDSFPKIMMPYNPPWYAAALEEAGFQKAKDLNAYIRFAQLPVSPRMEKIISRIETRTDWRARHLRLSSLEHEMEIIRQIYNEAWADNWSFVHISSEEMVHAAKMLKPILKPEYGHIIEVDGVPAAFAVIVPDINPLVRSVNYSLTPFNFLKFLIGLRKIRQGRLMMLGVRKEFRNRGFELVLVKKIIETTRKANWLHGELSWILEDNRKIISVIEESGGRLYKQYRIYEKSFVPPAIDQQVLLTPRF
jgi:GNAT superfamily N-acetyltransferase